MIAIDVAGRGRAIVLLHGVGADRGIWRKVRDELASDRRVLAPDLPGFGDSTPVGEGFALDEAADALADGLRQRQTAAFDLVGNSLGGAVALVLALRPRHCVEYSSVSDPGSRPVTVSSQCPCGLCLVSKPGTR